MISKETFCKALQMIQEQSETDAEFSRALDLVGDGHFIFGVKNKYFEACIMRAAAATDAQSERPPCPVGAATLRSRCATYLK